MEFFHQAYLLRREVTTLLLHDFGVKNRAREPDFYARIYEMSEGDAQDLARLCENYGIARIADEWPSWLIDEFRRGAMTALMDLVKNITAANSCYPVHVFEYEQRRSYQNAAIANVEELEQVLQYACEVLPVDVNRYMRIIGRCEREIALLKGWRKSDNKILNRIKKRG